MTATSALPDTHRPASGAVPPALALHLGAAGLLPFVGGAVLVWAVRPDVQPYAVLALATYAALIVSFLGGLHWGVAALRGEPTATPLLWGVMPSLLAWPAIVMPPSGGLVVLGLLLLACYAVDRKLYPGYGLAGWLTLRFRLSTVAAISCFLGAAGT